MLAMGLWLSKNFAPRRHDLRKAPRLEQVRLFVVSTCLAASDVDLAINSSAFVENIPVQLSSPQREICWESNHFAVVLLAQQK